MAVNNALLPNMDIIMGHKQIQTCNIHIKNGEERAGAIT